MQIKKIEFEIKGKTVEIESKITRKKLITLLGDPDDVGGMTKKMRNGQILKYDELEFHFDGNNIDSNLFLIYSEYRNGICTISIPMDGKT